MTALMVFTVTVAAVCGAIDARTGLIPDRITLPSLVLAVLVGATSRTGASVVLGAILACLPLVLLLLVTRGRGIGWGDVKLAALIGAGLGPPAGLIAVGCAFVIGGAVAAWLLAVRRARRGDTIAFGPYLASGAAVLLIGSARGCQLP